MFYYVTVMNENYAQPSLPAGAAQDIVRGMYRFGGARRDGAAARVRLLGSRRDPARGDRGGASCSRRTGTSRARC